MKKEYLLIASVIVISIVGFSYFNYKTKVDTIKLNEQAKIDEEYRLLIKYQECTDSNLRAYITDWNSQCEVIDGGDNCSLPKYLADDVNQRGKEREDRCIKLYAK